MGNSLYKFQIDPPATADRVKGAEITPDRNKGASFRIERMWVNYENKDAIATTDKIGIQITKTNQNEATAFLMVDDEFEVFTWYKKETFTQDDRGLAPDANIAIEVEGIAGTMLESGKKHYINSICTGQDGADVITHVKILGQYTSAKVEDWSHNIV